jgi:hypothetical protein
MIGYTTLALASKLRYVLNLDMKQVAICSGDYLKGKIIVGEDIPSVPAMSLLPTTIAINRNRPIRGPAARKGIVIRKDKTSGDAIRLKLIPLDLSYSVTILINDTDKLNDISTKLVWFFYTPSSLVIPITLSIYDVEETLEIIISDETAFNSPVEKIKQEEWDGGVMFRIDMSFLVYSYSIDPEHRKLISVVNAEYKEEGGEPLR